MNTKKSAGEPSNPATCLAFAIMNKHGDIVAFTPSYESAVLLYGGYVNIQSHEMSIVEGTWMRNDKAQLRSEAE